jgi:hypothetical protein
MGGIRALPSSTLHQPRRSQPIDHHRQQPVGPITFGETVPELAEHRMIKPGLGQLHPEGVLPVDAAGHRPSRLPVGEILRVLQHRRQRQPGRGNTRPTIGRKPSREVLIHEQVIQPVPDPHRRCPLRIGRPRHPRRLHRNRPTRTTPHRHPAISSPGRRPRLQRLAADRQPNQDHQQHHKSGPDPDPVFRRRRHPLVLRQEPHRDLPLPRNTDHGRIMQPPTAAAGDCSAVSPTLDIHRGVIL